MRPFLDNFAVSYTIYENNRYISVSGNIPDSSGNLVVFCNYIFDSYSKPRIASFNIFYHFFETFTISPLSMAYKIG